MSPSRGGSYAPRSGSQTASEEYLTKLCRLSFLRLWSWPNPYRDQEGSKEGKEICDLLVVFGRHVIIFSDKTCAFPASGTLALDWSRWFKRAVLASADQIWGAERWLRRNPAGVFEDRACTRRLPINFPSNGEAVFHRVVVAHGSGTRCREEVGGTGSLMIRPSLVGEAHHEAGHADFRPFTVGRLSADKGFVHVIDDFSLDVLLSTLDTVGDFVRYLEQKEQLISDKRLISAAGEEDLLAHYLMHLDDEGEYEFPGTNGQTSIILEPRWVNFHLHPARIAQIEADKISYVWDGLIEQFTKHLLGGTQYFRTHPSVADQEAALRFFAGETRFSRRMLARALMELLEKGNHCWWAKRWVPPTRDGGPLYVFMTMKPVPGESEEGNRKVRAYLLEVCCLAAHLNFPEALDIVGLATDPLSNGDTRSEDFLYLDGRDWTPAETARAEEQVKELGVFTKTTQFMKVDQKYPRANSKAAGAQQQLSEPCDCGSGRKFGRCCGR